MGGEDLEQMDANYKKLLIALGDDGFAKALSRAPSESAASVASSARSATPWPNLLTRGHSFETRMYRRADRADRGQC